jgi:hypothetical protein
MAGTFQTVTNAAQAPGIAGDFASTNPRALILSSMNGSTVGIVAGPGGVTVGLFVWLDQATFSIATNYAPVGFSGQPNGFAHRDQSGLITTYLTPAGLTIPAGFPAGNIFDAADFWVMNNGTTEALPGQKAYANLANGQASFAATGNPTSGASSTGSIAAGTGSATGTITGNVFTAVSGLSGTFVPGAILTGTGVATGTMILAQTGGTAGGIGTYTVSIPEQSVASTAISATYGIFTAGTTTGGSYGIGDILSGTGVTSGTYITGLGTGTGGVGTYYVTPTQTASSTTIAATSTVETGWYCRSFGAPGEVVKMSSRAMG